MGALPGERALEQAREELGFAGRPAPRAEAEHDGVQVRLERSEAVAATQAPIAFVVEGPASSTAAVRIGLPTEFTRRAPGGLPYVGPRESRGGRVARVGRELTVAFAGTRTRVEIPDRGLPAGTYRFPVTIDGSAAGTLGLRLYAPTREAAEDPAANNPYRILRAPSVVNTAPPGGTESETYVTVSPADANRIVTGYNNNSGQLEDGTSLSVDGGKTFTQLRLPTTFDAPQKATPEVGNAGGDPMSVGDTLGNIWYGGLSRDTQDPNNPSRIYVNRIDPSTNQFQPQTVGLPFTAGHDGQQDKNMMTIDNSASSPTFGRLYVVWGQPGLNGGVNMELVSCDTRVAGAPAVARCDDADNWSNPIDVYPGNDKEGSYIYADAAVGPDGTVYFVNWDYSARNAVIGATCTAVPRTDCGTPGSFSAPKVIATLESYPGTGPVPFGCPTYAEPGGRTGVVTGVDTDISDGPGRGRVYVTWGDLRDGSGTTRCEFSGASGTPPALTNLTWDPWVASATDKLPGPSAPAPSAAVGTKMTQDAGASGVDSDDDWFPWLAVDQSTGQAWADWYSTRGDTSRRTAEFHLARVSAADKPAISEDTVVSIDRSDFSTEPCCTFFNDYGDYTGIDAARSVVVPIWTSSPTGAASSAAGVGDDGDPLVAVVPYTMPTPAPPVQPPSTTTTDAGTPPPQNTTTTSSGTTTTTTTTTTPLRPGLPAPSGPGTSSASLRLGLAVDRALRRSVRVRGVRARVRCSQACSVVLALQVDAATRKRLGLRSATVRRVTARFTAAGRRTLTLRLPKALRRRLTTDGRARLTLVGTARSQNGVTLAPRRVRVVLTGR